MHRFAGVLAWLCTAWLPHAVAALRRKPLGLPAGLLVIAVHRFMSLPLFRWVPNWHEDTTLRRLLCLLPLMEVIFCVSSPVLTPAPLWFEIISGASNIASALLTIVRSHRLGDLAAQHVRRQAAFVACLWAASTAACAYWSAVQERSCQAERRRLQAPRHRAHRPFLTEGGAFSAQPGGVAPIGDVATTRGPGAPAAAVNNNTELLMHQLLSEAEGRNGGSTWRTQCKPSPDNPTSTTAFMSPSPGGAGSGEGHMSMLPPGPICSVGCDGEGEELQADCAGGPSRYSSGPPGHQRPQAPVLLPSGAVTEAAKGSCTAAAAGGGDAEGSAGYEAAEDGDLVAQCSMAETAPAHAISAPVLAADAVADAVADGDCNSCSISSCGCSSSSAAAHASPCQNVPCDVTTTTTITTAVAAVAAASLFLSCEAEREPGPQSPAAASPSSAPSPAPDLGKEKGLPLHVRAVKLPDGQDTLDCSSPTMCSETTAPKTLLPPPPYQPLRPSLDALTAVNGPGPCGYTPFLRHHVTHVKLQGVDPSMIQPGYEERLRELIYARTGRWLSHVYVRSGCIELVIDCEEWGSGVLTRASPCSTCSPRDSHEAGVEVEVDPDMVGLYAEVMASGGCCSGGGGAGGDAGQSIWSRGSGGGRGGAPAGGQSCMQQRWTSSSTEGELGGSQEVSGEQRWCGAEAGEGGGGCGDASGCSRGARPQLRTLRVPRAMSARFERSLDHAPTWRDAGGAPAQHPVSGAGSSRCRPGSRHYLDATSVAAAVARCDFHHPMADVGGGVGTWEVVQALQLQLQPGMGGPATAATVAVGAIALNDTGSRSEPAGGGSSPYRLDEAAMLLPTLLEGCDAAVTTAAAAAAGFLLGCAQHGGGGGGRCSGGDSSGGGSGAGCRAVGDGGAAGGASDSIAAGVGPSTMTAAAEGPTMLFVEGQPTTRPLCDSSSCRARGHPRIASLEPRVLLATESPPPPVPVPTAAAPAASRSTAVLSGSGGAAAAAAAVTAGDSSAGASANAGAGAASGAGPRGERCQHPAASAPAAATGATAERAELPLTLKAIVRCNSHLLSDAPLELLVRSEGRYLPAVITSGGGGGGSGGPPLAPRGDDAEAGSDVNGRLSYNIMIPPPPSSSPSLSSSPSSPPARLLPGILLVDLRVCDVPVHAAPVLVVRDAAMASELRTALATAQLSDDDRDSLLMDLGTWVFHAAAVRSARQANPPHGGGGGAAAAAASATPGLDLAHLEGPPGPAVAASTDSSTPGVVGVGEEGGLERLGMLGLHLLRYALVAGWWCTAASLAEDLTTMGMEDAVAAELELVVVAAVTTTDTTTTITTAAATPTSTRAAPEPAVAAINAADAGCTAVAASATAATVTAVKLGPNCSRAVATAALRKPPSERLVSTGLRTMSVSAAAGTATPPATAVGLPSGTPAEPGTEADRRRPCSPFPAAAISQRGTAIASSWAHSCPGSETGAPQPPAPLPSLSPSAPSSRPQSPPPSLEAPLPNNCSSLTRTASPAGQLPPPAPPPPPSRRQATLGANGTTSTALAVRGGSAADTAAARGGGGGTGQLRQRGSRPSSVSTTAHGPAAGPDAAAPAGAPGGGRGAPDGLHAADLAAASDGGDCGGMDAAIAACSVGGSGGIDTALAAAAGAGVAEYAAGSAAPESSLTPLGALLVEMGLRRPHPAEEAAYQAFVSPRIAAQGCVITALDLLALATLLLKSIRDSSEARQNLTVLACWVGVLEVLLQVGGTLSPSRARDWPRLHQLCKILRYLSYLLAKVLCALGAVAMPMGIDSYLTGVAIFVQEGLVHPASCLLPLPVMAVLSSLRVIANAMVIFAVDRKFKGGRLGGRGSLCWAAAISAAELLTSAALHVHFRMSYSRWAANKRHQLATTHGHLLEPLGPQTSG